MQMSTRNCLRGSFEPRKGICAVDGRTFKVGCVPKARAYVNPRRRSIWRLERAREH